FFAGAGVVLALISPLAAAQSQAPRGNEAAKPPATAPKSAQGSPAAGQPAAKPAASSAQKGKRKAKQNKSSAPARASEESPKPAQGAKSGARAAAVGAGVAAGAAAAAASSNSADAAGGRAVTPSASPKQASLAPQAPPRPSVGESIGLKSVADPLSLHSSVALVVDARNGDVLVRKNPNAVLPIASITKLMTAIVVLDAGLPLNERLQITRDDIDRMRHTSSRLHPGAWLTRAEMLQLALMSSENRAANALGRHYPGGMPAFVAAMNAKSRALGLHDTRFVEPTGLSSANVSSGRDLAQLVRTASSYPLIRQYSTARSLTVQPAREALGFYNTNRLISTAGWSIGLQKTGFISEAGNCLVMVANVEGRPLIFVLLDAAGKLARFGDAQRIRAWVEKSSPPSQRIHAESEPADRTAPLRVSMGAH
ncbi:MAG: D-alanyl-D-alanine endopeptidase, partial [Betaproteobacteria bacterium]